MDKSPHPIERRESPRVKARCEAQLVASVSLLDAAQREEPDSTLVLMGKTQDISAKGLGLVLPSIRIDEKFCEQARTLKVLLRLPRSSVQIEANIVRCVPLQASDPNQGYLVGAEIIQVSQPQGAELRDYLQSLSSERE